MKHSLRLLFSLIGILFFFFLGHFLQHTEEYFPYIPEEFIALFSHTSHLVTFAAYALVVWVLLEESMRGFVFPRAKEFLRDEFLAGLFKELKDIRETVAAVLGEQGLLKINPIISVQAEEKDEQVVKNLFESEMGSDSRLQKAESMVKKGNYAGAVEILEKLTKQDEKYTANLVTTLVFSPELDHWKRAEEMLINHPDLAEPEHYLRLAYKEWMNGSCESARRLAERALNLVTSSVALDEEETEWRVKNSLAYYYADCDLQDYAKNALAFSTGAIQDILPKKDQSNSHRLAYARRLATLGYVRITFGNEKKEILSGIHDCEEARRLGSSEELYFRHLARAQSKLESIRYQDQTS